MCSSSHVGVRMVVMATLSSTVKYEMYVGGPVPGAGCLLGLEQARLCWRSGAAPPSQMGGLAFRLVPTVAPAATKAPAFRTLR